jgi:hypothetical protein
MGKKNSAAIHKKKAKKKQINQQASQTEPKSTHISWPKIDQKIGKDDANAVDSWLKLDPTTKKKLTLGQAYIDKCAQERVQAQMQAKWREKDTQERIRERAREQAEEQAQKQAQEIESRYEDWIRAHPDEIPW